METTSETPHRKKAVKKKRTTTRARWTHRALGVTLWGYFIYINTSLMRVLPPPSWLMGIYGHEHRWWRWLVYLVVLGALYKTLGFFRLVYLALFPAWGLVLGIYYLFKASAGLLGVNQRLLATTSSRRAGAASYLVMPFCYLAITDTTNPLIVSGAGIVLLVASLRTIFGVFRWVMRPLEKLAATIDYMNAIFSKSTSGKISKMKDAIGKGKLQAARNELESTRFLLKALYWIRARILKPRILLGLFLVILGFTILLVIVNFGFMYYGLNKVSAEFFNGGGRSFWDFAYFSTMVMTTSGLTELAPNSWQVELLTVVQLGCSLTLLSFLLFVFSTSGQVDLNVATLSLERFIKDQLDVLRGMGTIMRHAERQQTMTRPALTAGDTVTDNDTE